MSPRRPWFSERRKKRPKLRSRPHLLEATSARQIRQIKLLGRAYTRLQWDYYSELAYYRAAVADRLTDALSQAADGDTSFSRWQRVVRVKYMLQPLSVAGSLKDPGGRFNIGDIDAARYPQFPALYIAQDRVTALQEALGVPSDDENSLAAALARPDSIANFSLSGSIDSVIDLDQPERLQPFIDVIRTFTISSHLQKRAQALRANLPNIISTVDELLLALLSRSWRFEAAAVDIPSPSQIFGQLIANAGISGVAYPSKFTGKKCLAIFPQNFRNSDSSIELDDETPAEVDIRFVDAAVWQEKGPLLCGRIR